MMALRKTCLNPARVRHGGLISRMRRSAATGTDGFVTVSGGHDSTG